MSSYNRNFIKSTNLMKNIVNVIGLGYIGLPTAAILSNKGFFVKGIEKNLSLVKKLNNGIVHIKEPSLERMVKKSLKNQKLKVFSHPQKADIHMICVPTPFQNRNGKIPSPDLRFIFQALKRLVSVIKSGDIIILESTSPVGTTERLKNYLSKKCNFINDIYFAYCPERVLPGNIVHELQNNDRIVGGLTKECTAKVSKFYKKFVKGNVLETNAKTAELCKLAENSFRDVNIAFANELSMICDKIGVNHNSLIDLANKHPRVNILEPGIGVGGHCIPVDPWFIVSQFKKNSKIIKSAREVNDYKTDWLIKKIKLEISKIKSKKKFKITVLGLSYKPDVDDFRGSPAIKIVKSLSRFKNKKFKLQVVEPNIPSLENIELVSFDKGIDRSQLIIFLVNHREFATKRSKEKLLKYNILDFCNYYKHL